MNTNKIVDKRKYRKSVINFEFSVNFHIYIQGV